MILWFYFFRILLSIAMYLCIIDISYNYQIQNFFEIDISMLQKDYLSDCIYEYRINNEKFCQ
jgi:hypothetical protein